MPRVVRRIEEHSETSEEQQYYGGWSQHASISTVPHEIPRAQGALRLSPALDPLRRMALSRAAKWVFLIGVLLLVFAAPLQVTINHDRQLHHLLATGAAVVLGAVIATGIPRLAAPGQFGRWPEATDAFRDWTLISVITGGLYGGTLTLIKKTVSPTSLWYNPFPGASPDLFEMAWLQYRAPIVLICGVVGLLVARAIALRQEGVLASDAGSASLQITLQAVLVGAANRPIEFALHLLSGLQPLSTLVLGGGIVCIGLALAVIIWAYSVDARLIALHRQRHPEWSGVDAASGIVPMTLTVVGGRESGKTVLLAAAYWEWSTKSLGKLRIVPTPRSGTGALLAGGSGKGTDLAAIAQELYGNHEFPIGTQETTSLDFDLMLGKDPVVRFSILDYPGGATTGRVPDARTMHEFWTRVEQSDGVLFIADMSYARRNERDKDFLQVYDAYRQVMRRVIDSNGRNRVVPVALVLTKCDEWLDPDSRRIDVDGLDGAVRDFGYRDLEREWEQLCMMDGPGKSEFVIWMTSAITYSEPQVDMHGEYDLSMPFRIAPPPPPIIPTGCASPLLWMTAKVMRWNVTMFRDLSSFFFGSSPKGRQRIEAIEEMERIADEQAAVA